jgi:hypothetical protein
MTATSWFLLGLWVGCSAGFLLSACVSVARDGEQRSDSALKKLRSAARRVASHNERIRVNLLRMKTARAEA